MFAMFPRPAFVVLTTLVMLGGCKFPELPPIEDYLAEPEPEPIRRNTPLTGIEIDDEGWAAADWQSYDWSRIATLGAPAPEAVEAHAAWSSTDWDPASRRGGTSCRPCR